MAENLKGSGEIIELFNVTAGSSLQAGNVVGFLTGTNVLRHIGESVTGAPGSSGQGGNYAVGILEEDITSTFGPGNVRVIVGGIIEALITSAAGTGFLGQPLFIDSATVTNGVVVDFAGHTGETPIGTLIGHTNAASLSGTRVLFYLKPGALRWSTANLDGSGATITGINDIHNLVWPPQAIV